MCFQIQSMILRLVQAALDISLPGACSLFSYKLTHRGRIQVALERQIECTRQLLCMLFWTYGCTCHPKYLHISQKTAVLAMVAHQEVLMVEPINIQNIRIF